MTVRELVREAVRRLNAAADGDPMGACRHCFDGGERPTICLHHPDAILCASCQRDHLSGHELRCEYCGAEAAVTESVDTLWPFDGVRVYCDGASELGTLTAIIRLSGVGRCQRCERIAALKARLGDA